MIGENVERLRGGVLKAYSAAAERPNDEHPFPVGRGFARSLGYGDEILAAIPSSCVDGFTGVSNVSLFADIPKRATVLDLGCGAGLDALVAAKRVGPSGKVIGVDFSESMVVRARKGASEAGLANVEFHLADVESLPLGDSSVDVAMVNGIFNLNPRRAEIFSELARVVRPGGGAFVAELILGGPLGGPLEEEEVEADESNWFS